MRLKKKRNFYSSHLSPQSTSLFACLCLSIFCVSISCWMWVLVCLCFYLFLIGDGVCTSLLLNKKWLTVSKFFISFKYEVIQLIMVFFFSWCSFYFSNSLFVFLFKLRFYCGSEFAYFCPHDWCCFILW